MRRSSRLVQASQSLRSFPAPLGTADRVTNPVFKAGLGNNPWVPEGREIPAEYSTRPPRRARSVSPRCQTPHELLGLNWAPLQLLTCAVNSRQRGLVSACRRCELGDIYRPWLGLDCPPRRGRCANQGRARGIPLLTPRASSLQANANCCSLNSSHPAPHTVISKMRLTGAPYKVMAEQRPVGSTAPRKAVWPFSDLLQPSVFKAEFPLPLKTVERYQNEGCCLSAHHI